MSSRLAGRRVSMAPNRVRRPRRDPNAPSEADDDAGGQSGRYKNAIFNDEIARLLIREEDLVKVSQEARASVSDTCLDETTTPPDDEGRQPSSSGRRVAVRWEIPEAQRRPLLRRVVLLNRAPPDAPLRVVDPTHWRSGPRLDSRGNVVAHSLLGRPEEYYRIALLRGDLRPEDVPPAYRPAPPPNDWGRDAIEATKGRSAQQRGVPAGSADCHWTSSESFGLPALEAGEAEPDEAAARLTTPTRSSMSMQRMTEHVNLCGIASPMKHPTDRCSDWDVGWQRLPSRVSTPRATPLVATADDAAVASAAARSAKLLGAPRFSFIGGWSYQKEVLLG